MSEKGASLKYHYGVKSMRSPIAIYADKESLIKKNGYLY